MKPMEAWKIVSGCLSELANIRHSLYSKGQGYSQEEITAQVICFEALRRMDEEEKNEHDNRTREKAKRKETDRCS